MEPQASTVSIQFRIKVTLINGEDLDHITLEELSVGSMETNPSIRPSWKITSTTGS